MTEVDPQRFGGMNSEGGGGIGTDGQVSFTIVLPSLCSVFIK